MNNGFFRKKNVNFIRDVSDHTKLKKTLGAFDLLCIGLGAVIGTGVFVLTGVNSAVSAGPAVTISFILAGITCVFVALAYTEVAASLPSSGGSYTYAYVALGEVAAWVVGWAVIVQIGFGSTTVASGWSGYILGVFAQMDIYLPEMLTKTPFEGGIIDLPAFLICIFLTAIVYRGTHESSMLNIILVIIKLSAIFLFIIIASGHFDIKNWGNNLNEFMPFGFKGVTLASGALFLSYTGFDVVANATEESKNPSRDVTIGLIGSILISMLVYVLVAGLVTGIAFYGDLNNKEPLAYALKINGSNVTGTIVAIGGIIGMTTVILVQIFGLSRVFMAMSRDGLMPKCFNKIHPKFSTPHIGTLIVGVSMGLISGLVPIKTMGDLASLGTLFVLSVITICTVMLRKQRPNIKRPFRCPGLPVIAPMALLLCGYLAFNLIMTIGWIFGIYMLVGIIIYFMYSRKGANRIYTKNH